MTRVKFIPLVLLVGAVYFMGLHAYWAHAEEQEKQKIVARMSPFEKQMWSEVHCNHCMKTLAWDNPKDGLYTVDGKEYALHGACADIIRKSKRKRVN